MRVSAILILLSVWIASSAGEELEKEQIEFFEKRIRPVLIDSCYECHSKEAGENKGGLTLDTRFALREGGNSGAGVVPESLEASWIWLAVSHTEPDYEMPPKTKLPGQVIDDFRIWIEMGAPDPREEEEEVTTEIDIKAGREFWSFQAPKRRLPPEIEGVDREMSSIDRFVFAKRMAEGLEPAEAADPQSLLRRLCFDLVGIPPSADFASKFHLAWESDPDKAIESTVDQLLASQQFGERWGRHWLDVARYAESNGKGSNQAYPNAWRYRDYVIDSINQDKPWDQFITEQLAGDLLPATTAREKQEQIIATGFLALGPKNFREKSSRQFRMDLVDEQIDTMSKAFLGLTVSCARCHDHKSDPIPTSDYYSMAGILLNSKTYYGTSGSGTRFNTGDLIALPLPSETGNRYSASEIAEMKAKLAVVNQGLADFHAKKRSKMEGADSGETGKGDRRGGESKRLRTEKSRLSEMLEGIDIEGAEKAFSMGMQDKADVTDTHVLVRGEIDSPAQMVPRGFLQVLNHYPNNINDGSSGRLELARWISSPRNPLTARVMVNRVWEKLFGRGVVTSTDNFGNTGQAPSHPALLDYLAIQFIEDGWSLKAIVKQIVLTRTYRMSSQFHPENYRVDPENKFIWRAVPGRLDAESFRDSILAVSGQLELKRPFGSPVRVFGDGELGRSSSPDLVSNFPPYRSVYLPTIRDAMPELIDLFDGADPNVVDGRREESNGAEQSLYLLNNSFIIEQADHFAEVLEERSENTGARVQLAFLRAYGREPTEGEYSGAIRFYKKIVSSMTEEGMSKTDAESRFLSLFCQGLLASAEFRYLN